MTDLDTLLKNAKQQVDAMSPAERAAMYEKQRESFARSARPAGYGMSRQQIEARLQVLNDKIRDAPCWGAALSAMDGECTELQRSLRTKV